MHTYHERELTDTRNLDELLAWLEYGKESGFKAARCSEAQEHHWADLLRQMLSSHAELLGVLESVLAELNDASTGARGNRVRDLRGRIEAAILKAKE